jgi:hypothetical protein
MGTLQFQLPAGLSESAMGELKRACMAGGQDNMPFLTHVTLGSGQLRLSREEDESGFVAAPWEVDPVGTLMTSTATLIERATPYSLVLELARGKVNQLRNQSAEWLLGGLAATAALPAAIKQATASLGRAVACSPSAESAQHGQIAINEAYAAADLLIAAFIQQVFQVRHQRQPTLDTALGCRLGTTIPGEPVSKAVRNALNTVCLPMNWAAVQITEKEFHWEQQDRMLDWALANGIQFTVGPLIDFHMASLPSWLLSGGLTLAGIASACCTYVATAVKRYRGRIRTWNLASGGNANTLLGLGEDEMLWLTLRIAEAARQFDPNVELMIGITQPWGEYLVGQARRHSPFVFADTLVRSGMSLAGLDLEIVMGVSPRGSYCRDLLEASRLIDLYSLLGVPLQITLGLPSDANQDLLASPEMTASAGRWRDGFTPDNQADWAAAFGALALCKPTVRGVHWTHLSDAEPHMFPASGLVDARGNVKPALARLGQLRAAHLR